MKKTFTYFALLSFFLVGILAACTNGGVPKLAGTSWRLTTLNGSTIPADVMVTLLFDKDSAGGKAACNSYGGSFSQSGEKLTFGGLFQTEMWCDGLMDYESAYLAALSNVKSFTLDGDSLILMGGSGSAPLVFVRQ